MKLSSKAHYGLIACHYIAKNYPDNPISAKTLENMMGVSGKYLEKIMRMLSSRGIISATRGVSGGYSLNKPPDDITVGEIVRALEDDMEIIECVKVEGTCKCCPSALVWKKFYVKINEFLDSMTLKQVVDGDL